jgi:hypothetical protein
MKRIVCFGAVACLLMLAAPAAHSQSNQLMQGTQLRLVLLNGLSTSVTRDGDPFTAVVSEPVFLGGQLTLPAGARVHGVVGKVVSSKRFNLIRGQAAMVLRFQSIEVEGREVPAQMSILVIQQGSAEGSRKRKDLKTEEGALVEAKPDIKGDLELVGLSTGGGSVVGAVFSHVVRGLALGLAGGTAYVLIRKGKDVELPAQTMFLVRLDNTVALPAITTKAGPYNSGER